MQIHGLNKTTLLDYPEHVAATVFTGGCNFRCPFCHNADLVLHPMSQPLIKEEEVFSFLKRRQGIIDGVCITGGEPTLQADLVSFISKIKELNFLVKLDTNGYKPDILQELIERKMLDYVSMDIKSSKEKYPILSGVEHINIREVEKSVDVLKQSKVEYEFRTTIVKELHEIGEMEQIGEWLQGAPAYYLQAYRQNENVSGKGFTSYSKEELENMASILRRTIKRVEIRGIE